MMQVGTMALGALVVGLLAEVMGPQVGLGSFAPLLVVLAIADTRLRAEAARSPVGAPPLRQA